MIRGDVPPSKVLRLLKWSPVDSPWRASVNGGISRLGWTGGAMPGMADLWDLLAALHTPKNGTPSTHPRWGKASQGAISLGQMFKNRKTKGRGDA